MDDIVFNNGYIDATDLNKIDESTRNYVIAHWVYSKNKFTQKVFYIKPPISNNHRENIRFKLLNIACERQPETYAEKLMRELNMKKN